MWQSADRGFVGSARRCVHGYHGASVRWVIELVKLLDRGGKSSVHSRAMWPLL